LYIYYLTQSRKSQFSSQIDTEKGAQPDSYWPITQHEGYYLTEGTVWHGATFDVETSMSLETALM
jgi:hypothetical protein